MNTMTFYSDYIREHKRLGIVFFSTLTEPMKPVVGVHCLCEGLPTMTAQYMQMANIWQIVWEMVGGC